MANGSPSDGSRGPSPLRRSLYQAALPAMPSGIALWLIGMNADHYGTALVGLLLLIGGAFLWQDDTNVAHPG